MAWKGAAFAAVLGAMLCASPAARAAGEKPDFAGQHASADVQRAAHWIVRGADHAGLPFAIVDKRGAHLYVFDSRGRLQGASPALLGQTPGDDIAPDVGKHTAMGRVPVSERTTPAGRFVSHPGQNISGEAVVWVDYDSAFAIHRLRPGASHAPRAQRLATPTPDDNRVSLGCVIVPVAFYKRVVDPVLGRHRAVVYVLPESGRIADLANAL
jgi:hypothetical protein